MIAESGGQTRKRFPKSFFSVLSPRRPSLLPYRFIWRSQAPPRLIFFSLDGIKKNSHCKSADCDKAQYLIQVLFVVVMFNQRTTSLFIVTRQPAFGIIELAGLKCSGL